MFEMFLCDANADSSVCPVQDAEGEGYEEISSDEANLSDFEGADIDRTMVSIVSHNETAFTRVLKKRTLWKPIMPVDPRNNILDTAQQNCII